ncbi:MAG: CDP-alcohol phosphatidyltransferase family protein [Desulfobulbaceae bacterium]|nr:CDP-alcohol phosphatidyltransferase family protein [Desulfobulbaceae bacterium]
MRFVPNLLSLFRLGLAVIFPFCPEKIWIWLIVGSGCSDFLDGWIARRWQVASWQGGLLDAVADKTFVLVALITFVTAGKFSVWWIPAVIARDLLVASAAAYATYCKAWEAFSRMEARWSGKLATAGQFLLFLIVALDSDLIPIVLCITVIFSVVSAIDYGVLFVRELNRRAEEKSSAP